MVNAAFFMGLFFRNSCLPSTLNWLAQQPTGPLQTQPYPAVQRRRRR
jgi:hypothetical protein